MSFTRYHISYSAEEDRIFVFVREGDEVEHAFGLSRRLTKRMWPKMLKAFPAARARVEQVPAPYHNEVRKLDHEGAVSRAKEDGVLAPERLGEARERHDYLTTAVRITRRKDGARTLVFVSAQRQLNLPLTAAPLRSVLRGLAHGRRQDRLEHRPALSLGAGEHAVRGGGK